MYTDKSVKCIFSFDPPQVLDNLTTDKKSGQQNICSYKTNKQWKNTTNLKGYYLT